MWMGRQGQGWGEDVLSRVGDTCGPAMRSLERSVQLGATAGLPEDLAAVITLLH